jgi:2-(1,2-epoxy-1,2-dihydrophenyl)acetyl-CoA isomerase
MNLQMFDELREVFEGVAGDRSVRVVSLSGAEGNFCSGGDLTPDDAPREDIPLRDRTLGVLRDRVAPMAKALHAVPQPTLAVVEGKAAGAGANLAFGCDLVLAAGSARFSQIFVRRALSLDCGGSWLLPRRVGLHKAKELALFGDWIEASEALALGLVNRVVPTDELGALARDWCERLASRAPGAMAAIKRSLNESSELSFSEALERETLAQVERTSSGEFAEAMAAFIERREPEFSGEG